ncbi:unnamed protein product [Vicia faba]|uniref:Uncharacterized protein n=1 Tax=Vicia faba TaxID=3906 RepID=A0AAV0YJI3_VICFA|nr:unnamed protein product [Vicia faba]
MAVFQKDIAYEILYFENTTEWSPTSYTCNIYHGREGMWKTMENDFISGGRNMKFNMPVFHDGVVHFISDCSDYFTRLSPFYKPYIMSYNFEKGTTAILKLPREAIRGFHICNMGIFSWGKVTNSASLIMCEFLRKLEYNLLNFLTKVNLAIHIAKTPQQTVEIHQSSHHQIISFSIMKFTLIS